MRRDKQIRIKLKFKRKPKKGFIFPTVKRLFYEHKEILIVIPEVVCMKGFIEIMNMPFDKKSDLEIDVLSKGIVLIDVDNFENKTLKKEAILLGLDRYVVDGKCFDYDLKIIYPR